MTTLYKVGEAYKVLQDTSILELNSNTENKHSLVKAGDIFTVLSRKEDTVSWVSGGKLVERIYYNLHILYENKIWEIDFGENHNNQFVKINAR